MLSQALCEEQSVNKQSVKEVSLSDRFHLDVSFEKTTTNSLLNIDDILPEDEFHDKDTMSNMILSQRRHDHEIKQKECDEKRILKQKEYQEKVDRVILLSYSLIFIT